MDIEFKYGQKKRRIVMVVGVVLAVVAFGGVLITAGAPPATAVVPTQTVLVAVTDIPPRTVLDSGMLTVRTVPQDASLAQVYADATAIIGRTTAVQIYAQQMITPNLMANSLAGAAFSIMEPGETITEDTPIWRAVSLSIPKDRAVGGLIEPGQHVDLFVTMKMAVQKVDDLGALTEVTLPDGRTSGQSTKITWKDVELLTKDTDGGIYIFKVNLHEAEEINFVQSAEGSSFGVALRADGDYRTVDISKYGETTDRLTEEYNYPMPQMIDPATYPQTSPEPGAWDPKASPAPPRNSDPFPNSSPAPSVSPSAAPSAAPSASPKP